MVAFALVHSKEELSASYVLNEPLDLKENL